jgi:hypothetical protein
MRYAILVLLVGCSTVDAAPLSEDQIVSEAFQLWDDQYPFPESSRCEKELPELRIKYVSAEELPCGTAGCMGYFEEKPVIYLSDISRTQNERTELLVHELAHWLISCSEQMGGAGDSEHTTDRIWHDWLDSTVAELSY